MSSKIIKWFHYEHLKPEAQAFSAPICQLARHYDEALPDGPEKSAGLRKLLEAKDALVRSALEARELAGAQPVPPQPVVTKTQVSLEYQHLEAEFRVVESRWRSAMDTLVIVRADLKDALADVERMKLQRDHEYKLRVALETGIANLARTGGQS
jgi:uncharacterized membrane protein